MGRNILVLLVGLSLALTHGCCESEGAGTLSLGGMIDEAKQRVRAAPEWSAADMEVWRFAKSRGVHGNDLSRRTVGPYELLHVRDLPEQTPPIHAGPSEAPKLWVVRDGKSLFTFDDPKMASVLMTDEPEVLADIFAGELNWMGADEIHALAQAQSQGVTTLSWIHNEGSYPSDFDNWVRVTVTASQGGTKIHSEGLKSYIRPKPAGEASEAPDGP